MEIYNSNTELTGIPNCSDRTPSATHTQPILWKAFRFFCALHKRVRVLVLDRRICHSAKYLSHDFATRSTEKKRRKQTKENKLTQRRLGCLDVVAVVIVVRTQCRKALVSSTKRRFDFVCRCLYLPALTAEAGVCVCLWNYKRLASFANVGQWDITNDLLLLLLLLLLVPLLCVSVDCMCNSVSAFSVCKCT